MTVARLKLEIVTAESPVNSGEVDSVIAPGVVGQFTVLPHHAAFMTMLEPGELCVRQSGEDIFIDSRVIIDHSLATLYTLQILICPVL